MKSSSLLDTDKEFAELYQRHADMVYRLCYIYLKILLMLKTLFNLYFSN